MAPERFRRDLGPAGLALVLAFTIEQLPVQTPTALLTGTLLACFWVWTALRVGAVAAGRLEPDGKRDLIRRLFFSLLFVIGSVELAAIFQQIDSRWLTLWNAMVFLAVGRGPAMSWARRKEVKLLFIAREYPWLSAATAMVLVLFVLNVAWDVLTPIYQRDDLTYHLVFPLEWFQSGGLTSTLLPFGNHSPSYHPKNTELLWTWLYLPSRQFLFLPLIQAGLVFATANVSFGLLRRCGASTRTAFAVSLVYFTCPVMLRQLDGGYVDIAFAFLLLLSLEFLFALVVRPSLLGWFEFCASLGMLLGTKSFGLLFACVVVLPIGILLAWQQRGKLYWPGWPRATGGLLAGIAAVLACGGWWYCRNYLLAGNPVFPLHVEIFGISLFEGAYLRDAFKTSELTTLFDLLTTPLWMLLAAGAAGTLALLHRDRPKSELRLNWIIGLGLLLPCWLALIFWKALPGDYARFMLVMVPLLGTVLVVPLESGGRIRQLYEFMLLGAMISALVVPSMRAQIMMPKADDLLAPDATVSGALWLVLGLIAVAGWLAARRATVSPRVRIVAVSALAAVALWVGAVTSDPFGPWVSDPIRRAWEPYRFLQQGRGPLRIAITGTNETLKAYGPGARHRVRYININDMGDAAFHTHFLNAPIERSAHRRDLSGAAYYRRQPDRTAWLRNLAAYRADLLIVSRLPPWSRRQPYYRDPGGFPREAGWALKQPATFDQALSSPKLQMFKIER